MASNSASEDTLSSTMNANIHDLLKNVYNQKQMSKDQYPDSQQHSQRLSWARSLLLHAFTSIWSSDMAPNSFGCGLDMSPANLTTSFGERRSVLEAGAEAVCLMWYRLRL